MVWYSKDLMDRIRNEASNIRDLLLQRLSGVLDLQSLPEDLIRRPDAFSLLFDALCDVSLPDDEARDLYRRIEDYRAELAEKLGREVDFRVAMLDFFVCREPVLSEPRLVDQAQFNAKVRLALVDELTGLYNRRFLGDYLEKEIRRCKRYGLPFSVIFADLDNFKRINDDHGHHVGDEVIRAFAGLIRAHLRGEDIAARYGGEEFVVVMPQTDLTGARVLAQRLLSAVRNERPAGLQVTFSGGVAGFPDHGDEVETILAKADAGLYNSKLQGKNQITITPVDQRRTKRFPVSVPVTIHADRLDDDGMTRDLSPTGLAFESFSRLEVGQVIKMTLRTGSGDHFEVSSQIVWLSKVQREGRFVHGAKYAEEALPAAALQRIAPDAR